MLPHDKGESRDDDCPIDRRTRPADRPLRRRSETVREAAQRLAENRIGAMPVVEGGRVIGIFSERDVLYCIAKHGDARARPADRRR